MPDQKGRTAEWKHALFEYFSIVNEAELRGEPKMLRGIADVSHRGRLTARMQTVAKRDGAAGIKSTRNEMRARIERWSSEGRGTIADVAIHAVRSFEQGNEPWLEERVDRERVRLVRAAGGKWRVETVQPLVSERSPAPISAMEETYDAIGEAAKKTGGGTGLPSVPYMNPEALYSFKSKVYSGVRSGEAAGWDRDSRATYRREAAVAYAERWWNEPNTAYEQFEVNCTNYVSQCLFAGSAPMNYTGRRDSGWWYKGFANGQEQWSYSWSVSNSFARFLSNPRGYGLRAEVVADPGELQLGDVICYDWDGNGRFQHSTIVTAFSPDGLPLVNANTVSSRHRYWDYRDSYAWTDRTQYRFLHITDEF